MSDRPHERRFQVFLLILGFALGTVSSFAFEKRRDYSTRKSVAKLLKIGVAHEITAIPDMMPDLKFCSEQSPRFEVARLRRSLKYTDHAALFFLSEPRDLAILEEEQLRELDNYLRDLNDCKVERQRLIDLLAEGATRERVASACGDYSRSLDGLRRSAAGLRETL